jgi:DNA-binding MarR family transcriptional regulator
MEAHLGYWLRYVSNQVSQGFSRRLAARGVTVAEWVLLRALFGQGAVVPSVLAGQLGMTRGAVSRLADRLAGKALLVQAVNATDRRYQTLALTETGAALVPGLAEAADANDAAFFGHLTPQEQTVIGDAMKGIVRRLDLRVVPVE